MLVLVAFQGLQNYNFNYLCYFNVYRSDMIQDVLVHAEDLCLVAGSLSFAALKSFSSFIFQGWFS